MGCLSVILLCTLGYSLFGIWGALLGVLTAFYLNGLAPRKLHLNDLGASFLQCMAKIAKSDGRVSQAEAVLIGDFIRRNYPPELHAEVRRIFNAARDDDRTFEYYCDRFAHFAAMQLDRASRRQFLMLFCSLAVQDGELSPPEMEMLRYAERALECEGVVDAFFHMGEAHGRDSAPPPCRDTLEEAFSVLGCASDCSDTELKKQYRKKCAEFHPDRLQSKGLPKQFLDYAEEQMKQINAAYSAIRKARGI